jgi:Raf kinase inhibitor-like YbhB/YbcL family protein
MRHASTRSAKHALPGGAVAAVAALTFAFVACAPATGSSTMPATGASTAVAVPSKLSSIVGPTPSTSTEASAVTSPAPTPSTSALALTSTAFGDGDPIPREFTCHGADMSPPLTWRGVPQGTAALVLFVDDPDGRDWVHWIVLDLAPGDGDLPQAVSPSSERPQQGRNDFGKVGYGGPCPPSGTHHYRFTLYALAAPLGLSGHPDGAAVKQALAGAKVMGKTTLVGTYRA